MTEPCVAVGIVPIGLAEAAINEAFTASAGNSTPIAFAPTEDGACPIVTAGSFRTDDGTSGRGASSATNLSMSTRRAFRALAKTRSWFSVVRWGRRIRTALRLRSPDASRSRMMGNLRQARAAWMRFEAVSSDNWRACRQ
jgi:hypothetical protein